MLTFILFAPAIQKWIITGRTETTAWRIDSISTVDFFCNLIINDLRRYESKYYILISQDLILAPCPFTLKHTVFTQFCTSDYCRMVYCRPSAPLVIIARWNSFKATIHVTQYSIFSLSSILGLTNTLHLILNVT